MTRTPHRVHCRFCRRRFASQQSWVAHTKHCAEYQLHKESQQAKTLPQRECMGGTVPKAWFSNHESLKGEWVPLARVEHVPTTVGGIAAHPHRYTSASRPRSQRQRLLVVQVHDLLRTLRDECIAHTRLAKLFGQREGWEELLCELHELTEGEAELRTYFEVPSKHVI